MEVAGVLELTALPSIGEGRWVPWVREADVMLVAGGDATYLCHWMRQSGLADLLPSPHVGLEPDNTMAAAERWAAEIAGPAYAIDDQTAIKMTDRIRSCRDESPSGGIGGLASSSGFVP